MADPAASTAEEVLGGDTGNPGTSSSQMSPFEVRLSSTTSTQHLQKRRGSMSSTTKGNRRGSKRMSLTDADLQLALARTISEAKAAIVPGTGTCNNPRVPTEGEKEENELLRALERQNETSYVPVAYARLIIEK
ncbi:unnamed protein product, partial [Phaeothamnion confervicola]